MAKNQPFNQQSATAWLWIGIVLVASVSLWPNATETQTLENFLLSHIPLVTLIILLYLLIRRLKAYVFEPMRSLSEQAKYIAVYKDYSLRLNIHNKKQHPQEVVALFDALNHMLEEIEHREGKLLQKTLELENARAQAESANIAKSQFMSNISHELRTPLNSVIGFASMIKAEQFGPLPEKYKEYVGDILNSSERLLEIINDILDLAKAETSKLTIQYSSFQISKIVNKALNMMQGRIHEGKIRVNIESNTPDARIVADRVRILQVLLNIISNAVKFSPPEETIDIRYDVEQVDDDVSYVTIEVSDNGVGMTSKEVATALERFNQLDAGLNRRFEGTGLGLPLSKKLIELHAGSLRIESTKGSGTKVKIKFISNISLLD